MAGIAIDGTIQQLRAWFEREKDERGLKDIKFMPSPESTLIGDAAKEVLAAVTADPNQSIDVTSDEF